MTARAHVGSRVSDDALGPAIPKDGYLVDEIGDRLFWLTDGLYQMMFLVADEGVVAVDAPPTLGNNITRAVKSVTSMGVTHAVYSHHHADHAGAMVLYEGAELHAHEETASLLRRSGDPNRPAPERTFSDSTVLEVGADTLELHYHGPIHSPGNTFIHLPAQRTLMLVDAIFPGWVPFATLAVSQDIPAWLDAPAHALAYPFDTHWSSPSVSMSATSDHSGSATDDGLPTGSRVDGDGPDPHRSAPIVEQDGRRHGPDTTTRRQALRRLPVAAGPAIDR